ncbi:MAG: molybdopterin oxidoreductase, partial [Bdellovibrionales bacterium]|nr:molybdopterin oxidoreductase [Bdellovibrionales bacterium]NQZ18985.1 molybdopterin oxidoreductase [Bdellovibrionales bacterium]
MGHSPTVDKVEPKKFELSGAGKTIIYAMMGLGLLSFLGGFASNQERVWHAYMTSYFFFSSICLGALFFTALQHVSNAGWSVNIRRICESFSAFLPVVLVGGLITALGGSLLFLWMDASVVANDPILMGKAP